LWCIFSGRILLLAIFIADHQSDKELSYFDGGLMAIDGYWRFSGILPAIIMAEAQREEVNSA
jgi:hypothetical protein